MSLTLSLARPDMLALGQRIFEKFPEAYMNGHNWEPLVRHYVNKIAPDLMGQVETDPLTETLSAYMTYSAENVDTMERLAALIQTMLTDEQGLMAFIEKYRSEIQWG